MLSHWRFIPVGLLGAVVACSTGCAAESDDDAAETEDAVSSASANAALEIHPLDIWARSLDVRQVTMKIARDGRPVNVPAKDTTTVFLRRPGTYTIHLEAPKHEPLDVAIRYDGGSGDESARLDAEAAKGAYSFGHTIKKIDGKSLSAHVLYLGLRHKWFSSEGRPAKRGNAIQLLMDGEEAWATVHRDLSKAKKNVLVSTWWWESDFELRRSPIGTPSDQRWKNTILGTLEAIPAEKRVLVGEFIGQDTLFSLLNTDSKLRAHAARPADRFEMMSQANETRGRFRFEIPTIAFGDRVKSSFADAPELEADAKIVSPVPGHDVDLTDVPFGLDLPLASYHQKFMVVDDDLAFIGGMNFRHVDWDTSRHEIYDEQRMKFGAWDMTRNSVASKNREPDGGPRKDYMIRVQGPAAVDAADVFHKRWEHLRERGVRYANRATDFAVAAATSVPTREDGVEVQVTATMPAPYKENAIAETWFNAIKNAEKYIYIEDQYFRMPMIHDELLRRMDAVPGLKLVVITKPVPTWSPECKHSYAAGELFQSRYPDRFLSLQLRTFDKDTVEFADIDVHSKMLIVDDFFMSVGSANKNNRGMVYEAELNVAVADPIVASFRNRILTNLLGSQPNEDPNTWFEQLRLVARFNDVSFDAKGQTAPPRGFVYSLPYVHPSACRIQSVGPDAT